MTAGFDSPAPKTSKPRVISPEAAVARLAELGRTTSTRVLLGLAGAPGAGKSTFAEWLAARTPMAAVVVPMDGFHLANAELDRLGIRARKGAPDTFDLPGYLDLLSRIRAAQPQTVYAPSFDRSTDEPTAGSIPVMPDARLVITEGNYLLHRRAGWQDVAKYLDEVWWIECPDEERRRRLIRRHVEFGRSVRDAERFVSISDEANAGAVSTSRRSADFVIDFA